MKKPPCPMCGLELQPGRQAAIGVVHHSSHDPQDNWHCIACGFTERIDVQHKNAAYRKMFVTVTRKPVIMPAEAPRKEVKAALVNNLICNIRKQRPEWNRKQVKAKAKELAESLLAGNRAEEHEYRKEIEKLRKVDYAEAQPVKPEEAK